MPPALPKRLVIFMIISVILFGVAGLIVLKKREAQPSPETAIPTPTSSPQQPAGPLPPATLPER